MLKRSWDDAAVVFALLSIWICAIMLSAEPDGNAREALRSADTPRLLVIDPGHGGTDGGAVGAAGTVESRVNWAVSVRLRDASLFLGIPAVMTRETEEIEYPDEARTIAARKRWDTRQRAERINGFDNALLVSVHQNYYPAAGPFGPQVLYSGAAKAGERVQKALTDALCPACTRSAAPAGKEIYIMSHVSCPALLVECGFLSNGREEALLNSEPYQIKLALVLSSSVQKIMGDGII